MLEMPDALVLTAVIGGVVSAIIRVPWKGKSGSSPKEKYCPDHSMLVEKTMTQDKQINELFSITKATKEIVIRIDQKIEDFLNGKKR